jgi:hypothetical protein
VLTLLGLPLVAGLFALLIFAGVSLNLRTLAISTLWAWIGYAA